MKRISAVLVAVAIAGAVVYGSTSHAAPDTDPWSSGYKQWQHKVPQKFDKEVQASFIDAGALMVNGLGFTIAGRGTLVYDMPALPTGGLITAGNSHICHDSVTTATLTNCGFGSQLLLGIDQVLPAAVFGTCNPYLTGTGTTGIVRCCGFQNDAGAFNIPDASYTISCIK